MSNYEDLVGEVYRTNGRSHRVIATDPDSPDVVLIEDCEGGELGVQNGDVVRVLLRQQKAKDE